MSGVRMWLVATIPAGRFRGNNGHRARAPKTTYLTDCDISRLAFAVAHTPLAIWQALILGLGGGHEAAGIHQLGQLVRWQLGTGSGGDFKRQSRRFEVGEPTCDLEQSDAAVVQKQEGDELHPHR